MGMLFISAAVAAALNHGMAMEDPPDAFAQCVIETAALPVDSRAGPLLVSLSESPPAVAPASLGDPWGQAALRPYDVMSSLGSGNVPAMPQGLTLADAPAVLPDGSPLTWVLAGVGLLGVLYVRRTRA
jgi:hypothetical protein